MSDTDATILLIDDEIQIRRILRLTLESNGVSIIEAATGKEGTYLAASEHPGLVLLDLGLPDMDGKTVLKKIREWSAVPIIILSVRSDENGKVEALELGADDYVTKPFGVKELLARINVALRRSRKPEDELTEYRNGELFIDPVRHLVEIGGVEIKPTATEFELLLLFAKNTGKLLTHKQIIRELWGNFDAGGSQKLRVHIAQLRKKIELDARTPFIITEIGIGYRMLQH